MGRAPQLAAAAAFPDPLGRALIVERETPVIWVTQGGLTDKERCLAGPHFTGGQTKTVTQKRQKLMTLGQYSLRNGEYPGQ